VGSLFYVFVMLTLFASDWSLVAYLYIMFFAFIK